MKRFPLLAAVLVPGVIHAAATGLPDFNSQSLPLPPLSLRDIAKGAPATAPRHHDFLRSLTEAAVARAAPKKIFRMAGMPIIEPDASVDYKIIVRPPDPAIDFKLQVKVPETENTK